MGGRGAKGESRTGGRGRHFNTPSEAYEFENSAIEGLSNGKSVAIVSQSPERGNYEKVTISKEKGRFNVKSEATFTKPSGEQTSYEETRSNLTEKMAKKFVHYELDPDGAFTKR